MSSDDATAALAGRGPAQQQRRLVSSSGNVVHSVAIGGNDDDDDDDDDDQPPVLMEAKLLELIHSLRQLISSNVQIEEALMEEHDEDLISALIENEDVIYRKRQCAYSLADRLRRHGHGVNVSLEDKIPEYDGSATLSRRSMTTTTTTTSEEGGVGIVDEDGGMHL